MPHYCPSCSEPHLMEATDVGARCRTCGRVDAVAVRQPLFVVVGASGSGKTTIHEELLGALRGECIVFDVDWLIDPFSGQPGTTVVHWPSVRDTWLHVAHGVAQNGLPTLLLGPLIPEHLDQLPGRRWVGEIHYLVLDCDDEERVRRLTARPPWRLRDIDAQLEFAAWLRSNLAPVIDTGTCSPGEVAQEVAAWVRSVMTSRSGG